MTILVPQMLKGSGGKSIRMIHICLDPKASSRARRRERVPGTGREGERLDPTRGDGARLILLRCARKSVGYLSYKAERAHHPRVTWWHRG
jgi:hypothetical protein